MEFVSRDSLVEEITGIKKDDMGFCKTDDS